MAFQPENMGALSYCNGFTIWYYRSETDDLPTILSDGYFMPFRECFSSEDVIFFTERNGRTGRRRIYRLTESQVTLGYLL